MYDYFTQLSDYLDNSTKNHANKVALVFGKNQFTYEQLDHASNQFANFLASVGISRGDRVVAATGNTYEAVIAFWASLKLGAVISLVSENLSGSKLGYILKDSGAVALVCNSTQYRSISGTFSPSSRGLTAGSNVNSSLDPAVKPRDDGKKVRVADDGENLRMVDDKGNDRVVNDNGTLKTIVLCCKTDVIPSEQVQLFHDAISQASTDDVKTEALDVDLASIIYTSGSTGEPKGVMLTHRNMLTASTSINQYLGHSNSDIIISALPLSFDYGLYQMIMAFSVGATLILENNFMWPAQLLGKIAKHQATVLPVVPSMVPLLQQHGERFTYDVSSIRSITNTGAALNLKHIDLLKKQFTSAKIFSMYGLTECKRCTYLPPDMIEKKPTSVGVAIPNTQLWVVNENGQRLGTNQVGQLVIRGATVMKGYWNKPMKTAEKLKEGPLLGEKVLYTGDYCSLDDDGYLYFHGRMDEMLKSRGIKVSPKEVETCLVQHPAIMEAAIIGIDDNDWGTALHAFIATSHTVSNEQIQHYCQTTLLPEQRPKYISIVKSLPKSSNGKIDKIALKARVKPQETNKEGSDAL